jgi:hypothetical protein
MNFYEEYLIKLQERMKRVDSNPTSQRLRSNKLKYEMQIELTKEQIEAWKTGKPFSDGGGFMAGSLVRAMGFVPSNSVGSAYQTKESHKYIEMARAKGLPVDNACDMTMMPFAMMESGDLPMDDLQVCDQHACTAMMLRGIYVAHQSDTKTYFIDVPLERTEESLKYVVDQLKEFIEFCEKTYPGIKYDESKLAAMQAIEEEAEVISFEIYEMLKAVPCPIGGLDAFSGVGGASSPKGMELLKIRRDEIAERVAKKIGGVPEEKLRMMWTVTRPFFMDPTKVLSKYGVVIPVFYSGPISMWTPIPRPDMWKRKLSPLERIAAHAILDQWGHTGKVWVDGMMFVCKDLKIDAIINYCMLGCTATLGLRKVVELEAEKQLGIPTLQLEGKQWDTDYADEKMLNSKLEEFAQMCLSNKGLS